MRMCSSFHQNHRKWTDMITAALTVHMALGVGSVKHECCFIEISKHGVGNKAGTVFSSPLSCSLGYERCELSPWCNTKWKLTCAESMTCWPFSTSLDIVKTCNFDILCCKKKWSLARLRYLGSAVALLHFSSHWLPGDREFEPCALSWHEKFCSNLFTRTWTIAKPSFHQVWIRGVKSLAKDRWQFPTLWLWNPAVISTLWIYLCQSVEAWYSNWTNFKHF